MVGKPGRRVAGMGLLLVFCAALAGEAPDAAPMQFKIDAPSMAAALIQFTQQSGLQLVYPTDNNPVPVAAPRVEGSLTPRAALERLLQDSGLTFEFVNAHTILVTTRTAGPRASTSEGRMTPTLAR